VASANDLQAQQCDQEYNNKSGMRRQVESGGREAGANFDATSPPGGRQAAAPCLPTRFFIPAAGGCDLAPTAAGAT
jgi:hypothetical protein